MKKELLFISLFSLISGLVSAQQVLNMSLYHKNKYYFNPGVAGTEEYMPVSIDVRKQWAGFNGSPLTQTLSTHANVGSNFGIGGWFNNEVSGPSRRTAFSLSMAYRLNLSAPRGSDYRFISFGLGGSFSQHKFEVSKMTTYDEEDLSTIVNNINYEIVPDANFGIYYKEGDKIFVGLSVNNLIQSRVDNYMEEDATTNGYVRQYYLMGGATFDLGKSKTWDFTPSALAQFIEAGTYQVEVNTKFAYRKSFWFAPGYRLNDAAILQVGYDHDFIEFAYSYDYIISEIKEYSSGSHEVTLRIKLMTDNKKMKLTPKK